MAITQQDRDRALKGLSDMGFTDPDDLELQGFLDENPAQPEPAPAVNLNDGVARTPQEIKAARQAAGLDPITGQAITATPETSPTVGDLGLTFGEETEEDRFLKQYDAFLRDQTAPIDEAQIKADAIKQMQAQIDATNKLYAEELRRAQEQGRGRLGTTTAIGARRGLIGSDFGESQIRETEDLNTRVEQSIEQERLARISALMNQAKTDASKEISDRRAAMLSGFESRKDFFAGQEERKASRAQKAVAALISQGVAPDEIDSADLERYAKSYGISTSDLKVRFDQAEAEREAALFERAGEELKRDKTRAEIANIDAEMQLAKEKFEEDKRQFGLSYALQQADLAIKQAKANREAGITGAGGISPKQQRALDQSNVALNSINEAFTLLDDSGIFDVSTANTAVSRVLASRIPGTSARDLRAAINSVQALIGFEELQKMRDASPTGGALGQVSEREISFLQALQGSLDIGQSTEQLISNLSDIRDSFTRLKLINSPDGTQFEIEGQVVEKQGDELVLVE